MSLPKKRAKIKQVAAQWCGGRATIVSWAKVDGLRRGRRRGRGRRKRGQKIERRTVRFWVK